ncbi:transposase [Kitasatospora indigofera]|uniref:transposase n=1 Tax=Kitasatospora indigofera TaxID=67307 RepID=UPI00365D7EC4
MDDELWARTEPMLPPWPERSPGPKPVPDRLCLQGILFVLYTGIPWQKLPLELGFGSGQTCWRRLERWQEAGVFERLHRILLAELNAAGPWPSYSPPARPGTRPRSSSSWPRSASPPGRPPRRAARRGARRQGLLFPRDPPAPARPGVRAVIPRPADQIANRRKSRHGRRRRTFSRLASVS